MLELSNKDQEIIASLKAAGVLQPLDPDKLPVNAAEETAMCLAILCADGHRFSDIRGHLEMLLNRRGRSKIHTFADHGAPLFLSHESPLNRNQRGNNLLDSIGEVPVIKGVAAGLICPHAPCGAATLFELSVAQQIAYAKAGKVRILTAFPKIYAEANIACLLHLTTNEGKELTYKVAARPWEQWAKQYLPSLLQVA
ncbi:MAG: hypothetical protein Q7K38_03275 [Candidatus Wildermuthbacteria bacterium]|nr:hypothetical protein [Candidatus Wildermuthbacteria bacterium]